MRRVKASVFATAFALLAALPLLGHHGTATSFDQTKVVRLTGTVKAFAWKNPHSELVIEGRDEEGNSMTWSIETGSPGQLVKQGIMRNSFRPGDEVVIEVHPSFVNPAYAERTGQLWINGKRMELADRAK